MSASLHARTHDQHRPPFARRQPLCGQYRHCCNAPRNHRRAIGHQAALAGVEKLKAGMCAKVEHPFRVIKRRFGQARVRHRGLKKNTTHHAMCAVRLRTARGKLRRSEA